MRLLLLLLLLFVGLPMHARADQEARAVELGSVAKCSQTWNAASIIADSGNSFGWHPSVTADKPCLFDANVQFLFLHAESVDPVAATAGTYPAVFSAMPAGHTNTYVLVLPEGYTGQAESGWTNGPQIKTQGRWAYRWYIYYSSNYQTYTGSCTNSSKWMTIQPSFLQSSHLTNLITPHIYGWAVPSSNPDPFAWNPDVSECCNEGPGYDSAAAADGALPGSWWRYEIVGHGMDGTPGAYIKVYRKNITSGGPERRIVDTTLPCVDCGNNGFDWPSAAQTALVSPTGLNMVTSNFYRAGTCAGYIATAYALFAQWDTDADQRIGAATEMEGGGGGGGGGGNGSMDVKLPLKKQKKDVRLVRK